MKLLIIGYGAMAKAILSGLINSKLKYDIEVYGRDQDKLDAFVLSYKNQASIKAICQTSNINCDDANLLLCVKPYALESFTFIGQAKRVYSVLAGTKIKSIQNQISSNIYIRIMPNIGAMIGKSASCVYVTKSDTKDMKEIQAFIQSFGNAVFVDKEELIDSSIATSGSSMAFLALVAEALVDAGVLNSLNKDQASKLVSATFRAFGEMLESSNLTPKQIKDAITSPGGTTAVGLAELESKGVRGAIISAATKSVEKAKAIGDNNAK